MSGRLAPAVVAASQVLLGAVAGSGLVFGGAALALAVVRLIAA